MRDQGEYLGRGYVRGTGQVYIFQDLARTDRLVIQPVAYDGGVTSVSRDRVSWRKSVRQTESEG